MKVKIQISARHIHLSRHDLERLFGAGYELSQERGLSLPGEFAAKETVELVSGNHKLKLRIVGPLRQSTQAEISLTDAHRLGVRPPLRLSGNLDGSLPMNLKAPTGSLQLESGLIIAQRHLHISPELARENDIADGQTVKIITSGPRALVFDQVVVRYLDGASPVLHLDTDEGNAAGLENAAEGALVV